MLLLDNTVMNKTIAGQREIAFPAVGTDRAAGLDTVADKTAQIGGREILHNPHSHAADAATGLLHGDDYQRFVLGTSPNDALLASSYVRFVDFDCAPETIASRPHHDAAYATRSRQSWQLLSPRIC